MDVDKYKTYWQDAGLTIVQATYYGGSVQIRRDTFRLFEGDMDHPEVYEIAVLYGVKLPDTLDLRVERLLLPMARNFIDDDKMRALAYSRATYFIRKIIAVVDNDNQKDLSWTPTYIAEMEKEMGLADVEKSKFRSALYNSVKNEHTPIELLRVLDVSLKIEKARKERSYGWSYSSYTGSSYYSD